MGFIHNITSYNVRESKADLTVELINKGLTDFINDGTYEFEIVSDGMM